MLDCKEISRVPTIAVVCKEHGKTMFLLSAQTRCGLEKREENGKYLCTNNKMKSVARVQKRRLVQDQNTANPQHAIKHTHT